MHSSCNLIKSSNTSVKGDIEIVTECVVTEEEQHFQEIENSQIKSYEVIGASILDKARKDSDNIIMEAFQYSKNIEKEAYEKGYAQGVNNGYEDGKSNFSLRHCKSCYRIHHKNNFLTFISKVFCYGSGC